VAKTNKMADVRSVESGKYNILLAHALKEFSEFKAPHWAALVKTSTHRQRPTQEVDFWHKRAASILRQLYIRGTVGVNRLRTRYGGRKDRGMKPAEFRKSGGKIIRLILQQAEAAGLAEKVKGKSPGRKLSSKGKEFLESVADKKGVN
jgi:small subunit ribosomal protein S19e